MGWNSLTAAYVAAIVSMFAVLLLVLLIWQDAARRRPKFRLLVEPNIGIDEWHRSMLLVFNPEQASITIEELTLHRPPGGRLVEKADPNPPVPGTRDRSRLKLNWVVAPSIMTSATSTSMFTWMFSPGWGSGLNARKQPKIPKIRVQYVSHWYSRRRIARVKILIGRT